MLIRRGEHDEVYWQGVNFDYMPETIAPYLRVPSGHHEDFFEALANLHCTIEWSIRRRRGEPGPHPYKHPGTREGVMEMQFLYAAVESSKAAGRWVDL